MNEGIATIERSVNRYGGDCSQLGELFVPARAHGAPVAVVLHGGFWCDAHDRSLMDELCEDLAEGARAAGDRLDLVVHEQLGHFEHLDPRSPAWKSVRDWLPAVTKAKQRRQS